MNYHQQARQALPELARLTQAHNNALTEMKRQPAASGTTTPADLIDRARQALLNGQPVDPDIGVQLAELERLNNEAGQQLTVIRQLATEFKDQAEEYERTHSTEMIETLQPELTRILTDAGRAIAGLNGARTADQVIREGTDALAAWASLDQTVTDYGRLRNAHWEILKTGWDHHDGTTLLHNSKHGMHSAILRADDLWDRETESSPPWPCDELNPTYAPKADRAFLMWAADHAEHVWLPTVPELQAETERYTEVTQPEARKLPPGEARRRMGLRQLQAANDGQGFTHGVHL